VQNDVAVTGGGSGATAGAGGASSHAGGSVAAGGAFNPSDAGLPDARYVDPGCPPAMKVQGAHVCNPFAAPSDGECGTGYRCVPYVQYADDCHTEEIGTDCEIAGTGRQGDDCSTSDCAAGFVCVTAGTGFECAALCQLTRTGDTCTSGLICSPLDVDGYFVCG